MPHAGSSEWVMGESGRSGEIVPTMVPHRSCFLYTAVRVDYDMSRLAGQGNPPFLGGGCPLRNADG
jgi:hypothetical protein